MKHNPLKIPLFIVSSFTLLFNTNPLSYANLATDSIKKIQAEKIDKSRYQQLELAYLDAKSLEHASDEQTDKANKTDLPTKTAKLDKANQSDKTEESDQANNSVSNQKTNSNSNSSSAESLPDSTQDEIVEKNYPDPYEDYNRSMYSFNKTMDKYLLKPVSQLYTFLIPLPAKRMVTNFYSNVQDFIVLINYILQSEFESTTETVERIALNSTFGILGFIDVASDVGWAKRNNDYGVTFGKWGMADSPYFIIPIFGPSTVRDAIGRGIGVFTSPLYFMTDSQVLVYFGVYMVDTRANLLTAEKIVDTVSDDEYVFIRNSYLEYRDSLIRGEKPNLQREANEENLMKDIFSQTDNSSDANADNNLENNSANEYKSEDASATRATDDINSADNGANESKPVVSDSNR